MEENSLERMTCKVITLEFDLDEPSMSHFINDQPIIVLIGAEEIEGTSSKQEKKWEEPTINVKRAILSRKRILKLQYI